MADRPRIALFCEDRAHEQLVRALVRRLADEEGLRPTVQPVAARGGHGRALAEFKAWQSAFLREKARGLPDLLVLIIDGNCKGWNSVKSSLENAIDKRVVPRAVAGCPDPHVERWYMADPEAFERVVGVRPGPDPGKCGRLVYKRLVDEAVEQAKLPQLTGSADLAPDLVREVNLYQAGKREASLGSFVEDLRPALQQLAAQ